MQCHRPPGGVGAVGLQDQRISRADAAGRVSRNDPSAVADAVGTDRAAAGIPQVYRLACQIVSPNLRRQQRCAGCRDAVEADRAAGPVLPTTVLPPEAVLSCAVLLPLVLVEPF